MCIKLDTNISNCTVIEEKVLTENHVNRSINIKDITI